VKAYILERWKSNSNLARCQFGPVTRLPPFRKEQTALKLPVAEMNPNWTLKSFKKPSLCSDKRKMCIKNRLSCSRPRSLG
jgi:hypothetical protein